MFSANLHILTVGMTHAIILTILSKIIPESMHVPIVKSISLNKEVINVPWMGTSNCIALFWNFRVQMFVLERHSLLKIFISKYKQFEAIWAYKKDMTNCVYCGVCSVGLSFQIQNCMDVQTVKITSSVCYIGWREIIFNIFERVRNNNYMYFV